MIYILQLHSNDSYENGCNVFANADWGEKSKAPKNRINFLVVKHNFLLKSLEFEI